MDKKTFSKLNGIYLSIVENLETQEQDLPEDEILYLLAFFGLFRSGCVYRIREEKKLIEEEPQRQKNGNKKRNEKTQEPPPEPKYDITRYVDIKAGGKRYSCLEGSLIDRFGQEYLEIREARENAAKSKKKVENKNDEYNLPYVNFDEPKKEVQIEKKEDEAREERKRIPVIENDTRYPDDEKFSKQYDTFLLNRHKILVTFSNGKPISFDAVVYPVEMDNSDTIAANIFVIVTDQDGKMRCEMSDMSPAAKKSVNAEFQKCTLVFRGEWEDGEFKTSAQVIAAEDDDHPVIEDTVFHVTPSARTSSYYLRYRGNDGTWLSAFPMDLIKNNPSTGLANSVVMIEDGYTRKLYVLDNTMINTWFDEQQRDIALFWYGNALELRMSDKQPLK